MYSVYLNLSLLDRGGGSKPNSWDFFILIMFDTIQGCRDYFKYGDNIVISANNKILEYANPLQAMCSVNELVIPD